MPWKRGSDAVSKSGSISGCFPVHNPPKIAHGRRSKRLLVVVPEKKGEVGVKSVGRMPCFASGDPSKRGSDAVPRASHAVPNGAPSERFNVGFARR